MVVIWRDGDALKWMETVKWRRLCGVDGDCGVDEGGLCGVNEDCVE